MNIPRRPTFLTVFMNVCMAVSVRFKLWKQPGTVKGQERWMSRNPVTLWNELCLYPVANTVAFWYILKFNQNLNHHWHYFLSLWINLNSIHSFGGFFKIKMLGFMLLKQEFWRKSQKLIWTWFSKHFRPSNLVLDRSWTFQKRCWAFLVLKKGHKRSGTMSGYNAERLGTSRNVRTGSQ
jgi:hypothetical protein